MKKIKDFINKLSNIQKITIISIIVISIVFINLIIPTFARFKNRNSMVNVTSWDGNIATSYRKGTGTITNPYIISNGNELAYFEKQLEENDYKDKYFKINSDIIINPGKFVIEEETLKYILDENTYTVNLATNEYRDDNGTVKGTIYTLDSLDNFKGNLDAELHTIYGFFSNDKENSGLFTNLEGNIENLYVDNALINGGTTSGIIASNSKNASIKNVMVDGNVISTKTSVDKLVTTKIEDLTYQINTTLQNQTIDINPSFQTLGATIKSIKLTGRLELVNPNNIQSTIAINGNTINPGDFEVDMGTTIYENFSLSMQSSEEARINITNLKYKVTYDYVVSGGIVGISDNTTITNAVNKANIYGKTQAGGIVGTTSSKIDILNSYNTGEIKSEMMAGGLISSIENSNDENTIQNCYNTGNLNALEAGGLISNIYNNTDTTYISYSFTTGHDQNNNGYAITNIINSNVNVINSYYTVGNNDIYTGTYTGVFMHNDLTNLESNTYFKEYLKYPEYVKDSNTDIWVYEDNKLPVLYFDDINNDIVTLHSQVYSWKNLSYELEDIGFKNSISFKLTNNDETNTYKNAYYYLSNQQLTKDQILEITNWQEYTGIETISTEGIYIIYIKVIDMQDNISYINSDKLIIDSVDPTISITLDDNTWTNYDNNIENILIDRKKDILISANDNLSGIDTIKYYLSNDELSETELKNLPNSSFIEYENKITIDKVSSQIIYAKVTDKSGNTVYANTDRIILDGYEITKFYAGTNKDSYEGLDINSTSKISMDISYNNLTNVNDENLHNLISNVLLPLGTKITLIDFIKNKVYTYTIETSDDIYSFSTANKAIYPFKYFKEVGSISREIKYVDDTYYDMGKVDEDFTITLDFSNATINKDYLNSSFYVELLDNSRNVVRPTLYSTIKEYNLYQGRNEGTLEITSDYTNQTTIELNSQSQTNIKIDSRINYKNNIIDTNFENKEINLGIKLLDEDSNIVTSDKMENIIIKYDDKEYHPGTDNIFHINLNNGIKEVSKNIQIITYENDNELKIGNYYFKIFNYVDGLKNDNEITINAKLTRNKIKYKYELNVNGDKNNKVILEKGNNYSLNYDIYQLSKIVNPSIKVSLYKKNELTSLNQDYTLIDLGDYTNDTLHEYINSIYTINNNMLNYDVDNDDTITKFNINLDTTNMEKNGYKLVFTLYDGSNIVGNINKYFLVK